MKRSLTCILLPLLLSQGIAMAQTELPNSIDSQAQTAPVSTTSTTGLQPSIIPLKGTDQIQLQLVNCNWILDCALANLLLPASTRIDHLQLQFDNPALVPAQVLNTATVVQGNFTRYQLTDTFSVPPGVQTLAANQIVSLPLTLNRFAMPPDQYTGAIYLTLANQTNRLVLPVSLNVRSGPLLPLLILLVGVVLGRLFKYMQEQGGPQAEARKKVYQLEADLKNAHPDDQKRLASMVKQARDRVYRQQLEAANTQVTVVQGRLEVLTQLRSIETSFQAKGEDAPDQVFEQIAQAREEIRLGNDEAAKTTLDQITEVLLQMPTRRGAGDDSEAMKKTLTHAAASLDQNARSLAIAPQPPTWMDQLQRVLIDLSGLSDLVRAEATYWFVRPLLYGVLLVGLTIVGLNTLYIEKGETFGARPLSDYLGLLLWGLSADVASRSLSGLQEQRE
ncbi:MAG: hypothetical protein HC769_02575 [Cyanobacteria bacterium CRU_2_1]|nr:hypothetical protein [Cyanobacteria bacterium CRU_2_1]